MIYPPLHEQRVFTPWTVITVCASLFFMLVGIVIGWAL